MAFQGIFVLPKVESFGERLGKSLGEGIASGTKEFAHAYGERRKQKQTSEYFNKLKSEHPDDPRYQVLADVMSSPISQDQRSGLARALMGHRENPQFEKQQQRLDRDSLAKMYNQKIRELDEDIKHGLNYDEREGLIQQKRDLQKERDSLFDSLKGMNPYDDTNDDFEDMSESSEEDAEFNYPKVRFDSSNPKHKHVRDKVLKQTKGDRKKAEAILKKRFRL